MLSVFSIDLKTILIEECDIQDYTLNNSIVSPELRIDLQKISITVFNSPKIFKWLSSIKEITPVMIVFIIEEQEKPFEAILFPPTNLPLIQEAFSIEFSSPIALFNIESPRIHFEGLINNYQAISLNGNQGSIFQVICDYVNSLYPLETRILKVNNSLSDEINKSTATFLLNTNDNVIDLIEKLCWEFSIFIYWDQGLVIKEIKPHFSQEAMEFNCVIEDNFREERVLPIKNRLTLQWTDKNFKSILELMDEDLRAVWNEKGRVENNKLLPLKPLFEGEYFPENSDLYDNVKNIDVGFLTKKLEKVVDSNKVFLVDKDLKLDLEPIILIEDSLILFNPYNEWFKNLAPTKDIMSKSDFYKKYNIAEDSKIFKLTEETFPTSKDDWQVDHPTKSFLMLHKYEGLDRAIIYSFYHQPRKQIDPIKKLRIDLMFLQVFASTHYRNTQFTMIPVDIQNTREELKEFYLYVNDEQTIREEYTFKQTMLKEGYINILFYSSERLEILKNYDLFVPMSEKKARVWLTQETITWEATGFITYQYKGFKIFDIPPINTYPVEITSLVLDISRKQQPILLKTIWDKLRFSYYAHFYLDDLPALAIEGVKKNNLVLLGFYTLYYINRIPEERNLQKQELGLRDNFHLVTPKNEVEKVKEYFKAEFGFDPKVSAVTGVLSSKVNEENIVTGDFEGKEEGGKKWWALPYRENFL